MPSPFGPWQASVDLATEGLFATALSLGAVMLWWTGRRRGLSGTRGWRPMVAGLSLFATMATLDFLDEFWDGLWTLPGADLEPYLEDLLMPLGGVGLLVAGILRWAPMHAQLAALQAERQEAEIVRLREMDVFKTTFLNTAAHELATPLTPIRIHLSMLRGGTGGSDMELLDRNVARLERLVQDLLDASRLQTGKLRFEMRRTDLAEVVEELRSSFTPPCDEKSVRLTVSAGPDLVVEEADQARVSQVLYNLVGNAVKFTPSGGEIRVSARREGDEVVASVEDTGAGLDPAELGAVFEPFQQFHRDLVGTHVGTGLGLYVAQGIAHEHGGAIEVHSGGRGRGARFVLRLPATATASVPVVARRGGRGRGRGEGGERERHVPVQENVVPSTG